MIKISKEIERAAKECGIDLIVVKKEEAEEIVNCIKQKYRKSNKYSFMWDELNDFSVINNKDRWTYIKDFIGDSICLLFFNVFDDKTVFKLNNGMDLHEILGETYGFEFYVTNMETQYLIFFSHHDCLYGCGTAKEWVNKLAQLQMEK